MGTLHRASIIVLFGACALAGAAGWLGANYQPPGNPGVPHVILKTSDESATNNTIQDDDQLAVAVAANATYEVDVHLLVLAGTTSSDIKIQFSGPTSATAYCGVIGEAPAGSGADNNTRHDGIELVATALAVGVSTSASVDYTVLEATCLVTTSGTAGTLQLRWAQNTTNASATTVKAKSRLVATRIS